MITTAKEYMDFKMCDKDSTLMDNVEEAMIEFARIHVRLALKAASEGVKMKGKENVSELSMMDEWEEIDRDSILEAYPIENIK